MMNSNEAAIRKKHLLRRIISDFFWFIKNNYIIATIIFLIAIFSFYPIFRTINYFNYFKINAQTLLDDESQKVFASSWPQYELIERINRELPQEATVMVFRMADFAFYGKRNYISYVDEKIAGHVLQKTTEDVWKYLLDKGVTHVYLPSYPLPSFYNSKLEKLLASPEYSDLLYDFDGFRLFKLTSEKRIISSKKIAGEDFLANPEQIENWNFYPQANANVFSSSGLVIKGDEKLLTNPNGGVLAYRGEMKYLAPSVLNEFEYRFKDDQIYSFNAEVEGYGFVESYIEIQGLKKGKVFRVKKMLWSGFVNNKREIDSQFAINASYLIGFSKLYEDTSYRIIFKVKSGDFVQINDWTINEVFGLSLPFQIEHQQMALFEKNGWQVNLSRKNSESQLKILPLRYGLIKEKLNTQIFVNTIDSREIYLTSPSYYVPKNGRDVKNVLEQEQQLYNDVFYDLSIKSIMSVSFSAKGEGTILPSGQIICRNGKVKKVQFTPSPVVLTTEGKEINFNFSACTPKFIRLKLIISPDKYSVGKTGEIPASIILQNLSMKIQFINSDREIDTISLEEIPFAIEYEKNRKNIFQFWKNN